MFSERQKGIREYILTGNCKRKMDQFCVFFPSGIPKELKDHKETSSLLTFPFFLYI